MMTGDSAEPSSEFPRPIDPRKLDAKPLRLEASETERAALAKRFALVSIGSLIAEVSLEPDGATVAASGRLRADIVQSCAVSGDDLPVSIIEDLGIRFVPERPPAAPDEEIELSEGELDEIEYHGTRFDLGEAVAQTLGLAIDPFAEGPGADDARQSGLISTGEIGGPFAALAALKKS